MHIDQIRRLSLEYAKGNFSQRDGGRRHSARKQRRQESDKKRQYNAYINSKKWRAFREKIFAERGRRCERCEFDGKGLQVHHLTYTRFGHELATDVEVLCKACHFLKHPEQDGSRKVAKTEQQKYADWFAISLSQEP